MSKQDRQGARTIAALEQKYNFGKSFGEVMGLVESAEKAANTATEAVSNLDRNLDQEEIFNRLTNNGELEGVYRGEDGQIYINASYIQSGELLADLIKTGVLSSKDGTVQVDLTNNKISVATLINGAIGKIEISASGIYGYGFDETTNDFYRTLRIDPGGKNSNSESFTTITSDYSNAGLSVSCGRGTTQLGNSGSETLIMGNLISIQGKRIVWKDNGDGTYTLTGV